MQVHEYANHDATGLRDCDLRDELVPQAPELERDGRQSPGRRA
ncbi:hypothetical protein [Catenuloplanes atrovinosus]|uniref:Uncharacterized protein n=1 Tax=Catenuloplanes atrovinosus TaxID=137266 RepID=A0AAE3YKN5_9ACTN|nr:hypothetical protein [Catenuloplanes atrovinosus]MDR7274051.1 hypothetical protein [Catenuloplanes atrovinosus]